MIDKDDIMQAARLLLPGVDCPIRPVAHDEELPTKKMHFNPPVNSTGTGTGGSSSSSPVVSGIGIGEDTSELGRRATIGVAFKVSFFWFSHRIINNFNFYKISHSFY